MAQVRVEFLDLGKGGDASPLNVIRATKPFKAVTVEVSSVVTAPASRPLVPKSGEWGCAVRLISVGADPVYVAHGTDPTATKENSLMLVPGQPEVVYFKDDSRLSFIADAT